MEYAYDSMAVHCYDYTEANRIDPNNHIDDIIRWAKDTMLRGADYAYDLPNIDVSVPKFKKWKEDVSEYLYPKTKKERLSWGLICCSFGYAVEEYVNRHKDSCPHLGEFTVEFQQRRGKTIPDIIIKKVDTDIAWLDITSTGSIKHINKKNSPGWSTKPIVVELVYPALDISKIILT